MRVLALDTTTRAGSVALIADDAVQVERPGDGTRSHAERLPGELLALLTPEDLSLHDVDLFAVAAGPGSFTGLRIGIATMQGLAFVCGRPVAGVSALEAVAQLATADAPDHSVVGAWIDAQRGEVFSALYRTMPAALFSSDRLQTLDEPSVGEPSVTLTRWHGHVGTGRLTIAGDGTERYRDLIVGAGAAVAPGRLIAGAIGRMAAARAARGETVGPAGVRPLYIRRPDAEIDRDKRAATSHG